MLTPNDFVKGQPILASSLNWLMAACKKVNNIKGVAPIEVTNNSTGITIRLADTPLQFAIGTTSTAITARSGTGPGSGSVVLQAFDGTNLSATPETVTAYLFSAATGGIASGKYCVVARILGYWWIVAAEC